MALSQDYKDILSALSDHNVTYMVVGGYAFTAYGHPRATLDLDIFVEASSKNADAMFAALADFGAPLASLKIKPSDFVNEGSVIQIGIQPCRIDIINKIDGVNFTDAYQRSVESDLDGIPVRVISLEDLLANKKASGRHKDLGDVETIEHMMRNKANRV